MPPPLPRCSGWAYSSLISPSRVSLPRRGRRVGLHIDLFEACSAFTRVAACTLARSPIRDPLIEGFSHFVTSMTAPIASGWSESPGGPCTHWKAPPCHGAPPLAVVLDWRGAHEGDREMRLVRIARPHLGAGDFVPARGRSRAGADRRQVRPRIRLAHADAEKDLAARHA